MGDMLRCSECGTSHYRNDPCPHPPMGIPTSLLYGLTKEEKELLEVAPKANKPTE